MLMWIFSLAIPLFINIWICIWLMKNRIYSVYSIGWKPI